jgi:hypothetical protein
LRAYVLIQTEAHGEPMTRSLMAIPGVLSAEDVTGAYDAVVLAGARSTRHLVEQIVARILSLPGVTRALPAPLIRSLAGRPDTESSDGQGSNDRAA